MFGLDELLKRAGPSTDGLDAIEFSIITPGSRLINENSVQCYSR